MLKDGLYTRFPKPDYRPGVARAIHDLEAGKVGLQVRAGDGQLDVDGRHRPRQGRPRRVAQQHGRPDRPGRARRSSISRRSSAARSSPMQPAVVTVGSIHGGTKHNIIPDEVKLQLTLRSFNEEVREQLIDGISAGPKGLAQAHKAPAPSVVGRATRPRRRSTTPASWRRSSRALDKALGASNVVEPSQPVDGGRGLRPLRAGTASRSSCSGSGRSPPRRSPRPRPRGRACPSLHSALYAPEPARASRPASAP